MLTTFQLKCPHCGTLLVAFELVDESWLPRASRWHVCARCNHCSGFVVIEMTSWDGSEFKPSEWYLLEPERFTIDKVYPSGGSEIPPHLPSGVEHFYRQGVANVPGNPDAAGTMLRKTLEATLRDKCPTAKGDLNKRIDQAATAGILTADLARYAHTIRLEGNEAAHGTYDEDDAQNLRELVTLILQYVYTLPGMREEIEAKARAEAEIENAAQPAS